MEMTVADLPIKLFYGRALVRPHVVTPSEKSDLDAAHGVTATYVFETKLHLRSQKYFVVVCSTGGSADYNCIFRPVGSQAADYRNQIEGLAFAIPGDGCIYASGHVNTMFDHRRKYCLEDDRLKEVEQPFHYVGLQSKTLRDLTFYSSKAMTNAVGMIAKGEFVEVLLAGTGRDKDDSYEKRYFLIRDQNGLTGWVTLSGGQEAEDIEGIFYAGD